LVIGIYPQPFTDWVVSATLMFANFVGPSVTIIPPGASLGG
jgi:NADH-quinone oxidoreductase subunit N